MIHVKFCFGTHFIFCVIFVEVGKCKMERLIEYVITILACLFLTFHSADALIAMITVSCYSRENGYFFKSKCFQREILDALVEKNSCDRLK